MAQPQKKGDQRIGHWTGWEGHSTPPDMLVAKAANNWPANGALKSAIWSGQDAMTAITSEASRDMSMWPNNVGPAWGAPPPNNDIIVDSQDKEAWPSIGDNSESPSEAGDNDNSSVKSVISSSSNSGLPPNSSAPIDAQGVGSKANNSNSAVWGSSFASDIHSQGPWGASQMSMGWGGPSSYPSSGERPTASSASSSMSWGGLPSLESKVGGGWQQGSTDTSWGDSSRPPSADHSSGWGSLPPTGPDPNAGTESWGRPSDKPPQAWGGSSQALGGWGQPSGPPPQRWGETAGGAADGAASGWGSSAGSKPAGPAGPSQLSAGPSAGTAGPSMGPGGPSMGPSGPSMGPGATGPGQYPSTWAQAACKGLPQTEMKSLTPPCEPPIILNPKEQFIAQAINSHEGWGKRPIRQDTSWEIEDSPRQQRRNSGSDDGSHWPATNNNGTAIWEVSKEGPPDWQQRQQAQGGGASGGNEWVSDNDHGTWQNPPGERQNQWNRPPPSGTEQWGQPGVGQWGPEQPPPPPSNMWQGVPKDNNHWDNPKEDNVWDRNGTERWNSSSSSHSDWGDAGTAGDKMMETGTWSSRGPRRPSSWEQNSWDAQSPPNQRRDGHDVDDGTSFWGKPDVPKPMNWAGGPPNGPMPSQMRGMPPDKIPPMWAPPPSSRNWADQHAMAQAKMEDQPVWMQQPKTQQQWIESQWALANRGKPPPGHNWVDPNDLYRKPSYSRSQQPQMRSKMLQQLMEMGFKREDAQNALITNNMNLESAIAELIRGAKQMPGRRVLPSDPMAEQNDMSQYAGSMPAAPMPSSQVVGMQQLGKNPAGVGNITTKQLLAHLAAAGAGAPQANNPVLRSNPMSQAVQKQQQMLANQLRQAAVAGLIPQALLTQQLTSTQQVQLQRLMELQKTYHNLVANQQVLQHQVMAGKSNPVLNSQLEQVTLTIPKIKEQLFQLQGQITPQAAQPVAPAKPTPVPEHKDLKDLQSSLAALQLPKEGQQQESRFSKWILPQNDHQADLNRAPGSKPAMSQASSPNMPSKSEACTTSSSSLPFSDSTWSSLPTSSQSQRDWPTTATATTAATPTSTTESPTSSEAATTSKESPSNSSAASSSSITSAATTTTASNQSSPATSSATQGLNINDMIPEFVPGKPWQGLTTKNVEDDPHITPGSVSRPSLSVNTIRDDYVMTTLGKSTSPSVASDVSGDSSASSSWSLGGLVRPSPAVGPRTSWSSTSSLTDGMPQAPMTSDLWGGHPALNSVRPPPGLPNANKGGGGMSGWQQPYNRSMSWAPGDNRTMQGMANAGWGNMPGSSALILKNLPQIDHATLKTLCGQHGPLKDFVFHPGSGQALVRYNTREEAAKAQKALNGCTLHNNTMLAEFVPEADAERVVEQLPSLSRVATSSYNNSPSVWAQGLPASSYRPQKETAQWNGTTSAFGSSMWGGPWSTPALDENPPFLGSDLLGSQ